MGDRAIVYATWVSEIPVGNLSVEAQSVEAQNRGTLGRDAFESEKGVRKASKGDLFSALRSDRFALSAPRGSLVGDCGSKQAISA